MRFTSFLRCTTSIIVSLGLVSLASAAPISMSVQVGDNPPTVWFPEPDSQEGTTFFYSGFDTGAVWECEWTAAARSNPLVQAGIALTNTSATTQLFTVTVTNLAAMPILAPSEMLGSVGGSLTDANVQEVEPGVWARMTNVDPSALYTALIDGSSARTLHDSIAVVVGQQGGTENVPVADFGIPVLEAGPAVSSDIGIQLRFSLSPGDTVGLTSVFYVIPEPATLGLLALGSVFMFRRRRSL